MLGCCLHKPIFPITIEIKMLSVIIKPVIYLKIYSLLFIKYNEKSSLRTMVTILSIHSMVILYFNRRKNKINCQSLPIIL